MSPCIDTCHNYNITYSPEIQKTKLLGYNSPETRSAAYSKE